MISSTSDYSSFLALVKTTNLSSLVTTPGRTLLVPAEKVPSQVYKLSFHFNQFKMGVLIYKLIIHFTTQAFSSLPEEILTRLRDDPDFAKETVERHLLREVLCCAGIQRNNVLFNSSRKRTASGSLVSVRRLPSSYSSSTSIIRSSVWPRLLFLTDFSADFCS